MLCLVYWLLRILMGKVISYNSSKLLMSVSEWRSLPRCNIHLHFFLRLFDCYVVSILFHWALYSVLVYVSIVWHRLYILLKAVKVFFSIFHSLIFLSIFVYCPNIRITAIRKQKKNQFCVLIIMNQLFFSLFLSTFWSCM